MALMRLLPIGRVYASEEGAKNAADRLRADNFDDEAITTFTPSVFDAKYSWMLEKGSKEGVDTTDLLAELIDDLHKGSGVPHEYARVYADHLQEGRSVVLITAPFGTAQQATDILDGTDTVDIGSMPSLDHYYHTWWQPAPLSDLLGLPVLSRRRSSLAAVWGKPLTERGYLPTRGWFGGLLKRNPAPLSSATGIRTLSNNATPLSSKVNMAVLKDNPTPLSSKVGMEVLKDNPTPLSSKVGIKVLSEKRPARESTSFGVPTLSSNPAPLSSLLGLPVLAKKNRK